ncbi:MAG: MerR family transcriptional regulator, partial [Hyphomicrobiales bacterium]|nr:MerR family transcriptional regulator [Hyphomicrobiales bacterium]
LLRGIRHLLYGEGYTLRGVQRIIREQGLKFVQSAGQGQLRNDKPALDELVDEAETADAQAGEVERSRGLFGLLPSLLGDRNGGGDPTFSAADLPPEPNAPPSQRLVPPLPGSTAMPRDDLRRLQAALHELAECRRLLDGTLRDG